MPCWNLIHGYRATSGGFTTNKGQAYGDRPLTIACGRCTGCRIDKSNAWAVRCTHEAQMHDQNSFITLTYDQKNLPSPPTLSVQEVQLFIQRLRKHLKPQKVRYFASGEYGSSTKSERPHYHLLLFGVDFPDKIKSRHSDNDRHGYSSETLDKIWGKGRTEIGELTYQSAAYTARYCMKKMGGKLAETHYQRCNQWGEPYDLLPEFALMSNKPGIGYSWLQNYASDIFPCDFVIIDGKKKPVPPYYFRKLEENDKLIHRSMQLSKKRKLLQHKHDNTPERLKVREKVQQLKIQHQIRNLS